MFFDVQTLLEDPLPHILFPVHIFGAAQATIDKQSEEGPDSEQ